jgi:hypothetical protein
MTELKIVCKSNYGIRSCRSTMDQAIQEQDAPRKYRELIFSMIGQWTAKSPSLTKECVTKISPLEGDWG